MLRAKYTPEFKEEAVRQVLDKGYLVVDIAKRLGIVNIFYTSGSRNSKMQISLLPLMT